MHSFSPISSSRDENVSINTANSDVSTTFGDENPFSFSQAVSVSSKNASTSNLSSMTTYLTLIPTATPEFSHAVHPTYCQYTSNCGLYPYLENTALYSISGCPIPPVDTSGSMTYAEMYPYVTSSIHYSAVEFQGQTIPPHMGPVPDIAYYPLSNINMDTWIENTPTHGISWHAIPSCYVKAHETYSSTLEKGHGAAIPYSVPAFYALSSPYATPMPCQTSSMVRFPTEKTQLRFEQSTESMREDSTAVYLLPENTGGTLAPNAGMNVNAPEFFFSVAIHSDDLTETSEFNEKDETVRCKDQWETGISPHILQSDNTTMLPQTHDCWFYEASPEQYPIYNELCDATTLQNEAPSLKGSSSLVKSQSHEQISSSPKKEVVQCSVNCENDVYLPSSISSDKEKSIGKTIPFCIESLATSFNVEDENLYQGIENIPADEAPSCIDKAPTDDATLNSKVVDWHRTELFTKHSSQSANQKLSSRSLQLLPTGRSNVHDKFKPAKTKKSTRISLDKHSAEPLVSAVSSSNGYTSTEISNETVNLSTKKSSLSGKEVSNVSVACNLRMGEQQNEVGKIMKRQLKSIQQIVG